MGSHFFFESDLIYNLNKHISWEEIKINGIMGELQVQKGYVTPSFFALIDAVSRPAAAEKAFLEKKPNVVTNPVTLSFKMFMNDETVLCL